MKYEKIILLGTGKLFLDCLIYVDGLGLPYTGYDMSHGPQKMTKARAEKENLHYVQKNRREVFEAVRGEEGRCLLLSVINPCIIPGDILEKENILALNCHQALLPRHKGRNAEAWAIFEGDSVSGITWHRMEPDVDAGAILIQKEVPVTGTTTSYLLFREQLEAAYRAFEEFMPAVLEGKETYRPQPKGGGELRYSHQAPGDGRLDLSWDGEKMDRFLRAMDYRGLSVLKTPVVSCEGRDYSFRAYRIEKRECQESGMTMENETITIRRPGYEIFLLRCSPALH